MMLLNVTWSGYYSDQIAVSVGSGYNLEAYRLKRVQHDYRQDRNIALPNPSRRWFRCWFHDPVAAILSSRRIGGAAV